MQTNKSDFYKKTYSSKIDTSNIKTTRSNTKNLDYSNYKNSKKTDVYSDKSGIYEVNTPDNKKDKSFLSSLGNKVVFLTCLVCAGVYMNSAGYLNINTSSTSSSPNIISAISTSIGSTIQTALTFLTNNNISIPSFKINIPNSEVNSNSDLIKIDEDVVNYISQDINNINNSNFTQQSDSSTGDNISDDDDSSNSVKN